MLSQDIVVCTALTTPYGRGVIVATWHLASSKIFFVGRRGEKTVLKASAAVVDDLLA
jgi:hypothetical protein